MWLSSELNTVQLKADMVSPPLINFLHPQMMFRIARYDLSSTCAGKSRPKPRKSEPRCFLLHARSGCIFNNQKDGLLPGRPLQLHMMLDVRNGQAADDDERSLSRGCFRWKLEVYQ